ncbi:MAG: choice-of-anchor B family protein, partial [Bacteroidetes bacterium]|nr:choice-of-anchor B family protein [Bacteroidota bacterium]
LGYLPFDAKVNDIWAYRAADNKEYALVGSEISLYVVDISNPSQATLLFEIPGDTSIWRDVKTYQDFAYVVNETGGGLLIADLSHLPDSLPYNYVSQIDNYDFQTAHNIFIDENGVAYLLGSNIGNKGAFMINVNSPNPYQPEFLGIYDELYVHDAYARGDTLYTAEISNGTFSIIDVSNKALPVVLARQTSSRAFTHNIWLSDDGSYLITTDEKAGAFVDIYDSQDLNNIQLLDQYQTMPGDSAIPHNCFFLGDYIFTSYYRNGLTLVDAHEKDNLVEIGAYDSSPFHSEAGFQGNWGVYPYLESGHIIMSDREEGLFILNANYARASYLSGVVFDTLNMRPVADAQIQIIGENYLKYTQFDGTYKIGVADSAYYDIRMYHPNCRTIIETNVLLETAIDKLLNFETYCDFVSSISNTTKEAELSIRSNPEDNYIEIQLDGEEFLHFVHLVNLQGQVVKSVEVKANNAIIQLKEILSSGVYILNFQFDSYATSKKIIKY